METISTINIEALPELETISESDKLYILSKRDENTYIKEEITISDLSSFFYAKDIVDKMQEKYMELIQLSGDFLNFLEQTYPTKEYISANYSTIDYFNKIFKKVESTDTVSAYLDEYATTQYNNYMKADAKAKCQKIKTDYQNDSAQTVMQQIDA
jgi:hypothetical protein